MVSMLFLRNNINAIQMVTFTENKVQNIEYN